MEIIVPQEGVPVGVTVGVQVLAPQPLETVTQLFVPFKTFQILVVIELAVVGKPWPKSHIPIPR